MNKADLHNEMSLSVMQATRETMEEAAARGELQLQDDISSRILDVGCGPGGVTNYLIENFMPKHATVVGCDISESMIDYANSKYGNERIKFKQLDIAHPHLEQVWNEEPFDKILSFYCLHWVRDHRSTAANMYKMLKPGGDVLLLFLASFPTFPLYEELAKLDKWKSYLGDVQRFISPYYKCEDPSGEFARVLKEAGFIKVSVSHKDSTDQYPSLPSLMKMLESLNPFWDSVPKELHADFLEEIQGIVLDKKLVHMDPVDQTATIRIRLITARASRP